MIAPLLPVAQPRTPTEWSNTASWRAYLVEQRQWAEAQVQAELRSRHPYARWRIWQLEELIENIAADLRELDTSATAEGRA